MRSTTVVMVVAMAAMKVRTVKMVVTAVTAVMAVTAVTAVTVMTTMTTITQGAPRVYDEQQSTGRARRVTPVMGAPKNKVDSINSSLNF